MVASSLLAVSFMMNLVAVIFVICAVLLILLILIQKGKGGGLTGALAGGIASGVLGAKSKEPLMWFTIGLVSVFLFLAVVMAKFYRPQVGDFGGGQTQQLPTGQQAPPVEQLPQTPLSQTQQPPPPTGENAAPSETVPPDFNMQTE
jgi:preprotein translocase subunit SecG